MTFHQYVCELVPNGSDGRATIIVDIQGDLNMPYTDEWAPLERYLMTRYLADSVLDVVYGLWLDYQYFLQAATC